MSNWKDIISKLGKIKPAANLWPAGLAGLLVLAMLPQTKPVLEDIPDLLTATVRGETSPDKDNEEKKEEESGVGNYEDGEYEGSSNGYGGTIRVKVTVKNKQITAVDILEASGETASFFERAKGVIDKVLKAQTWEVDVVSGATYSSRGILGAIQNALTGASVVNEAAETPSPAGSLESEDFETPADGYADGTYTGSGTGFGGTITVQVTISGGRITDIDILSASGETDSYLNSARSVIDRIISAQSPNVDTVSGATYSSNGIINAVKSALKKAAQAATDAKSGTEEKEQEQQTDSQSNIFSIDAAAIKTKPAKTLKDGVYAGAGTGFGGDIIVKVTVSKGLMTNIQIVSAEKETPAYFAKARNLVPDILKKQTADVDTISGATFSSTGIIDAVKQAMSLAAVPDGSGSDGGNEGLPEEKAMPAQELTDGVYTGTGEGYGGDITVEVKVNGGRITTIAITSAEGETSAYLRKAQGVLDSIMRAQSADVDVVSGATFSSNGLIDAVKEAVAKAVKQNGEESGDGKEAADPDKTHEGEDGKDAGGSDADGGKDKDTGGDKDTTEDQGGDDGTVTDGSDVDKDTEESQYKDGECWATVVCTDDETFTYTVKVTVRVENGRITNASAERYDDLSDEEIWSDNDMFFNRAADGWTSRGVVYEGILNQIVNRQSADNIDAVSKATYSSESLTEAARLALKELEK